MSDDYEEGKSAHRVYHASQAFAGLSRHITAEDAAKLFLPNVPQDMMQVSRPLPKARQEWIRGWKDAEAAGS